MGYFDFQKKSDCIVCIDSDGCAMDTMEVKHRTCFGPQWIKTFGLTEHEAECMELWLSINLYSITRGINRFKGLALALAEVEKRGLGNIEGLAEYEAWTKEAKELSNPTLGAWGLGWEVWLNGMEVTQFTYFQQVGGLECKPVTGEITYGLERLAMYIQGVDSVYDLVWSDGPLGKTTYGDVFHQNEVEQSTYNFEYADVDFLFTCFEQYEKEAQQLLALENPLPLPAYERILKAAHSFNLLDARKAISVTERQRYILRIRTLTKAVAEAYYASREALGFPMCNKDK